LSGKQTMAATLITQAEYARRRGVSRAAITKAIKSGRITPIDGRIDPDVADIQWARNTSTARAPVAGPAPAAAAASIAPRASVRVARLSDGDEDEPATLLESRARREAALAELAELELSEKRGELVSAAAIERAMATKIMSVRESLDTLADRITPLLAAETDPDKVYKLLRGEIRQVLSQLSSESRGPAAVQ
jgi:hypothetical protein